MPPFPKLQKSSSPGLKPWPRRKPLRKRSVAKAIWHSLYVAGLIYLLSRDSRCRRCWKRKAIEGHHPFGQFGALIMIFWPICRVCHDEIHANHNKARAEGWLF